MIGHPNVVSYRPDGGSGATPRWAAVSHSGAHLTTGRANPGVAKLACPSPYGPPNHRLVDPFRICPRLSPRDSQRESSGKYNGVFAETVAVALGVAEGPGAGVVGVAVGVGVAEEKNASCLYAPVVWDAGR